MLDAIVDGRPWSCGSGPPGGSQRQQLRWVAAGADGAVAELLAVVDQTVSPTQASLWLRPAALLPRR